MRRLSSWFSRSTRDSPRLPRDQTQEEIILRSDDSDSDKEATDGRISTGGSSGKARLVSTSVPVSAASSEQLLNLDAAKRLQERLFEAVSQDNVDQLKDVIKDIENQNFSMEIPELCHPEDEGMTALHKALELKKLNVAHYLVETQKKSFLEASYINIRKQIPPSRKTSLHMAAEVGDKELITKLLDRLSSEKGDLVGNWLKTTTVSDFKTASVVIKNDILGKRRVSAIHLAVLNGYTELIGPLLSYGFDVDCEDSESETPLSLAVQMGHSETAKQLIELGAKIDYANAYGCTPLHLAVSLGRKEMVRLLIDARADVNTERIKSPKTPIEMAANRGELKMVRALLKNIINQEYRHQAMMIAARKGSLDIVKCILENDTELLNRPDDNGNTVLLEAATGNYLPTVKYLIGAGADLLWKNHARQTVFDIAMSQSNNTLLQYLLEIHRVKKRDVAKEAFYLHVAAANGDIKKIEYLVESGIDFYALDEQQNTFLHTAAFHNRSNVLEKFITAEDDNDTLKNYDGETPMHIAAKRGYFACVNHLLKSKSKLSIADRNGQTPLHAALSSVTVSSRIVGALVDAIRDSKDVVILNEQDVVGQTALHLAAVNKRPEILKLLADLDPEIENKKGDTALHVLSEFGTAEVLETYLEVFCGPNMKGKIDHKDVDGFSALHRCAYVADAEKVDVMLRHGADLSLTGKAEKTVLHTMVDSYAGNPTLDDKLVQVYLKIMANATKWYCWKNDMRVPKEESKEFYLTQLDAVILLTSEMFSDGLNALQYASKFGATKLLKEMINTINVYRFNKNRPVTLKSRGLEELEELGSLHKRHAQKRILLMNLKHDDVLFDVTYLVPGLMPKPLTNVVGNLISRYANNVDRNALHGDGSGNDLQKKRQDGEKVQFLPESKKPGSNKDRNRPKSFSCSTESKPVQRSSLSCLELIVYRGDEDSAVDILTEDPFCSLVSNYWKMCRRTYEALMWIHVIFMICFTYFVMPSNPWLHWRFGTNSSTANQEEYDSVNPSSYSPVLFGIFLLWPAFNLFFSIVCAIAALVRGEAIKDILRGTMIRKLNIGEITSGLLRIPIGILLFIFDNLSQISSVGFGIAYIAWYVMFIYSPNAHRYLECLAMAFIFGWLHTISFVKGFKDWNAMAAILKQVLLKDITRFIYIYIFILISFGYAIHAIIQADYHLDPDYRSPTSTIYLTFYRMLSPGNVLDVSESEDYKRSGGSVAVLRAVCSAYSILSSVVLMNMLIAMMNSTYSDVKAEKSAAWRIESIRVALWVERHFPLITLRILNLKKTFYDSSRNRWHMRYKPEDGRDEWGKDDASDKDSDSSDTEDEEQEEERKGIDSKQNAELLALKMELARIREELEAKRQEDGEIITHLKSLQKEMKQIHELCLEKSQLARVGRKE